MKAILSLTLAVLMLAAGRDALAEPTVVCRETDGALELFSRGRLIVRYHTAIVDPPEGIPPVFRRSGFIHPVATPQGRVVTADFPPDHAHQHGLFAAWVKTTFEGRAVDFWNQAGQTGAVEHVRTVGIEQGDRSAAFTVELRHSDLTAPGGPKPVLQEFWTVRAHDAPEGFLFDIDSRQTCIADAPLVIEEYHYGGMGFRGSSQWFSAVKDQPAPFEFRTSAGLDRLEGNHTRPDWVLAHGRIDGEECGLAVMGHPANFRHPEPVRLHPTKPYFVFSPCVLGAFPSEPGVERRARYRYFVFDGPADAERINRVWEEFRDQAAVDR